MGTGVGSDLEENCLVQLAGWVLVRMEVVVHVMSEAPIPFQLPVSTMVVVHHRLEVVVPGLVLGHAWDYVRERETLCQEQL